MSQMSKFLATKSYHPANQKNQQKVFDARARHDAEQKRLRDRAAQLKADRDAADLSATRGLDFIYQPPPGLREAEAKAAANEKAANEPPPPPPDDARGRADKPVTMRELLASQGLQNAPLAGAYVADLPASAVVVKPFGKLLSTERCLRCGALGHSSADRACPKFSQDLDDSHRDRMRAEDPLAATWKFRVKPPPDAGTVGGAAKDGERHLHELVDVPPEDSCPTSTFLDALSAKQKRKLLRKVERLERKERKHKRRRRHKDKKRRRRSSSSSSSRSSSRSSSSSSSSARS
jgi:CBF1 interacting corepressor